MTSMQSKQITLKGPTQTFEEGTHVASEICRVTSKMAHDGVRLLVKTSDRVETIQVSIQTALSDGEPTWATVKTVSLSADAQYVVINPDIEDDADNFPLGSMLRVSVTVPASGSVTINSVTIGTTE